MAAESTNATAISTEATRAQGAESTLTTNLNQEIADRQAAIASEANARIASDNTLQSNIDAEVSTRLTADNTLQSNINAEATARTAEDNTLTTNLNQEILNRQAAVTAEANARSAADNTLQSDIDAEVVARTAADNTLTTNLNQEISDRQAAVTAEANARSAADNTLQSNIDAEASARTAADNTLQSNIDAETVARTAADNTLTTNLNQEISDRQAAVTAEANARSAADNTLQSNIGAETAARQSGDAANAAAIASETARSEGAESTLQTNINTEAAARQAGDATTAAAIVAETNRAQGVESTLQTNINNEASARQAADVTLQNNINSETAARQAGDATNAAAITAETNRAAAAESTLQTNINNEVTARQNAINTAVNGTANTMAKFSGTHAVGNSSVTDDGTTFAINTNKFTVTEANGNTSVAGTLGVQGLATTNGISNTGTITQNGTVNLGSSSVNNGSFSGYTLNSGTLAATQTLTNNGTITGGTYTGGTFNGSTTNGGAINGAAMNGGSVNGATINGGTSNGTTFNTYQLNSGLLAGGQTLTNGGTISGGAITNAVITNSTASLTALDMTSHQIHNVTDPSTAQDAATKSYADTKVSNVTASSPIQSSGGTTPNISLTGIVPIANGGTGANSFANAGLVTTTTLNNNTLPATLTSLTVLGNATIANTAGGTNNFGNQTGGTGMTNNIANEWGGGTMTNVIGNAQGFNSVVNNYIGRNDEINTSTVNNFIGTKTWPNATVNNTFGGSGVSTAISGNTWSITSAGAASFVSVSGNGSGLTNVTPNSIAGGDLAGSYPNPTIAITTQAGNRIADAIGMSAHSITNYGIALGINDIQIHANGGANGITFAPNGGAGPNDISGSGSTWSVTTGGAATFASVAVNGNLDMTSGQILNVINPINNTDAANKQYVDNVTNGAVSGTANTIAKFTGAHSLGNSSLTDNGTTLGYNGQISHNFTTSGFSGPYIGYNMSVTNTNGGTINNSGITGMKITATEGAGGDDEALGAWFVAVGSSSGGPTNGGPATAARFNASGSTTFNTAIDVTAGNVHLAPLTASMPVKTDASKNLVSSAIALASSDVSGVLPVANGGTGANSFASAGLVTTTTLNNNSLPASLTTLDVSGQTNLSGEVGGDLNFEPYQNHLITVDPNYWGNSQLSIVGADGTGTLSGYGGSLAIQGGNAAVSSSGLGGFVTIIGGNGGSSGGHPGYVHILSGSGSNPPSGDVTIDAGVVNIQTTTVGSVNIGTSGGTVHFAGTTSGLTLNGVTGILPVANGGTGSNTQNFVDLTTAQNVGGAKTFTSNVNTSGSYLIGGTSVLSATGLNLSVGLGAGSAGVGAENAFFGYFAGHANTGGFNTFLGGEAGESNTGGNNNEFIGYASGISNTTGSSNIFIGYAAGGSNSIGGNNTAIGTNANLGAGNLSNAMALGSGATVTASNTIQLGNAVVSLVNTSGAINSAQGYRFNGAAVNATYLRGNGANYVSSTIQATDIPNITESQVTNLTSDLAAKATDASVVHIAGTESVTGQKTFTAKTGIGTSPAANVSSLDITNSGGISDYGDLRISRSGSGTMGGSLTIRNSATAAANNSAAIEFDVDNTNVLNTSTGAAQGNAEIRAINTNGTSNATDLAFTNWNGTAEQEVARFKSTGDMTISGNYLTMDGAPVIYADATSSFVFAAGPNARTAGSNNTFIGNAAGSTTAGSDNVVVGQGAQTGGGTGNRSTYLGTNAGYGASGDEVSAVGMRSGRNNTGNDNTYMGYQAGYTFPASISGVNNVTIGANAGQGITSGSQNTFLGAEADASANVSNATAIGYNASVGTSNTIQLGNASVTTVRTSGTLSAAAASLTGDVSVGGNIGLGISNPNNLLATGTSNIVDQSGDGLTSGSMNWQYNSGGYAVGIENLNTAQVNPHGLLVKTMKTTSGTRVFTANANGTDIFQVLGNGAVNIAGPTSVTRNLGSVSNGTYYGSKADISTTTSGVVDVVGFQSYAHGSDDRNTAGEFIANGSSGGAGTAIAITASAAGATNNYAVQVTNGDINIGNGNHIVAPASSSTATVLGSNVSSISVSGSDLTGLVTGTPLNTSSVCTIRVQFASSWDIAPHVVVTAGDANSATSNTVYVTTTTSYFELHFKAGNTGAGQTWHYMVLGN